MHPTTVATPAGAASTAAAPTTATMKAIAVKPGVPGSVHLATIPAPSLADVPGGRGVLVKVLRVGVDGTDKEINAAEYGAAPEGSDVLVIGHEGFGVVESVGENVTEVAPGDYVVATVRRPGSSPYDAIGLQDMTTDDTYFERGINLRHGYLSEKYVESADFIVRVPPRLASVGVLLEPASVAQKAIFQAWEIQRRLKVWKPRKALVLGTGTLGLLASLFLRLRGLEVVAVGRTPRPYRNADLLDEIGVRYASTQDGPLAEIAGLHGPFDFILEGTGQSPLVFEAMEVLGKNGVLAMVSVTGGGKTATIPSDRINQGFVLGNKLAFGSVNAHRDDFERGAQDFARAELTWPGWLGKLLTHPVKGLENFRALIETLTTARGAIKVYCEVAPLPGASA
jgi:threonine dehydrogenase-like Zn-dependent dehydrogenase